MIRKLFYFADGNMTAFDENDRQVPAEQGYLFWRDLFDKMARGVVDDDTAVHMFGEETATVGEYRERMKELGLADAKKEQGDG